MDWSPYKTPHSVTGFLTGTCFTVLVYRQSNQYFLKETSTQFRCFPSLFLENSLLSLKISADLDVRPHWAHSSLCHQLMNSRHVCQDWICSVLTGWINLSDMFLGAHSTLFAKQKELRVRSGQNMACYNCSWCLQIKVGSRLIRTTKTESKNWKSQILKWAWRLTEERLKYNFENTSDNPQFGINQTRVKRDPPIFSELEPVSPAFVQLQPLFSSVAFNNDHNLNFLCFT